MSFFIIKVYYSTIKRIVAFENNNYFDLTNIF